MYRTSASRLKALKVSGPHNPSSTRNISVYVYALPNFGGCDWSAGTMRTPLESLMVETFLFVQRTS